MPYVFLGFPLVHERSADRRPVRRVGPQVFPAHHGVLHVLANPPDDHQHVVVLRHDLHLGSVRRHLLGGVRLRGRRHRAERAQPCLRTGQSKQKTNRQLLLSALSLAPVMHLVTTYD
jgi:hypothetical protein